MINLIEKFFCLLTGHFEVPYRGSYRCFNCGYSPKDKPKTAKKYITYLKNKPHPKRTGMCKECSFEHFDGKENHAPTCKSIKLI